MEGMIQSGKRDMLDSCEFGLLCYQRGNHRYARLVNPGGYPFLVMYVSTW